MSIALIGGAGEGLGAALGRVAMVCRGPKPTAVLKALGLKPSLTVPEPNTWREILAAMDGWQPLAGRKVFVQEYGRTNTRFLEALTERQAIVQTIPIYAWRLPEDVRPLERAIEAMLAGHADAVIFTSAQQLEHLLQVAGPRRDALLDTLRRKLVVASIGPVTSEALRDHDLTPDLSPQHPKMGHLVQTLAREAQTVLAAKGRGDGTRS
jgi:uroporphyrinogen-III synthase